MNLFLSPHQDDETLFGAFTLIREQPLVVICYPSTRDYGTTVERFIESCAAAAELGLPRVPVQWEGGDLVAQMRAYDADLRPARVWAPDPDTSHPEHRAVYHAAALLFPGRLRTYHTYQDGVKVRSDRSVPFEPSWLERKMRALLCYQTQLHHPRASHFFAQDLFEYYGSDQ